MRASENPSTTRPSGSFPLRRLLGKKTEENAILQEALEIALDRKWVVI
jgi:hypothetical protein